VGAIIGGIAGRAGRHLWWAVRRLEAQAPGGGVWRQVLPAIQKIEDAYKAHGLGYQDALDQLTKLETDAQTALGTLKGEGKTNTGRSLCRRSRERAPTLPGSRRSEGTRGGNAVWACRSLRPAAWSGRHPDVADAR
jgi:hypothetical protein